MRVFRFFVLGTLSRLWTLIPAFLSDPFDVSERWFDVMIPSPQWLFYVLLVGGVTLAILLTYHDFKKHGQIKLNPEYITDMVWSRYKQGQKIVTQKAGKGLAKSKFNRLKGELKSELDIPTIPVKQGFKFSKKEGKALLDDVIERLSVKMKSDILFDKETINKLAKITNVLNTNEAGLLSLVNGHDEYEQTEYELGRRRASVNSQNKVRDTLHVSDILNTILIAFYYFAPKAQRIMPNNKLSVDMMKQALNEVMIEYIKGLTNILKHKG